MNPFSVTQWRFVLLESKNLFSNKTINDDSWRHSHECLQWLTKVAETLKEMTLFEIQSLILFHLYLALILWYPPPLNSILCRCCYLCSRKNRKINIVSGKGRCCMVPRRSKIEFHRRSVSTLWSHIEGLESLPVLIGRWRQDKCTSV